MKKIPRDAEASNVLIGEVDFLDKPFVSFVRLAEATTLGGLTEVPVPTRYTHTHTHPCPLSVCLDSSVFFTLVSWQVSFHPPRSSRENQVLQ